jgi:general nucleoside transport system permease protein
MLVTSVVVIAAGASVTGFWTVMLSAPSQRDWVNITNQSAMLFLAGAAAAIAFRMKLFNIGIEGQYTLAAYTAALVAGFAFFPGPLNILVALVVAMITGAAAAGLAGILKVTRGVSEVISTIMLNAIIITLVGWLMNTYGQQVGQGRRTTPIPDSSRLLGIQVGAHAIWALSILAVIVGIAMWVLINRTRFGFDLRATGNNAEAAVASGVAVKRMIVWSMVISGGIAGLIWMPHLFGGANYYGPTFQAGLGFAGLAVALLGRNAPLGIAFGAVLFAWLSVQANPLDLQVGISSSVIQITQGAVVLAVVVGVEVARRWNANAEQRALSRTLARRAAAERKRKKEAAA